MKQDLLTPYRSQPLQTGWNPFLENDEETKIDFGVFVLEPGRTHHFISEENEAAILIVQGGGDIIVQQNTIEFDRYSWFDQPPWAVHAPARTPITVKARSRTEIALIMTPNAQSFSPRVYPPGEVENEHRGKGILNDAGYRIVRCVFDRRNAPPEANLVLGEVINFPGRWSSYPPHHHSQPELYYYRFDPEWGYGHGELGEEVFKIYNHDLLRITGERDHSQTAAPGFTMYYLWTIRHLPDNPYTGFTYTPPFEKLLK
ncbi:MAG: 5-deoxy-glucuronate isomerase [Candidatus Omnitrophica bacterium]|nr:5-deoxy-glucuronate isomerase [Candidatus Omnitrophota bacterium]